MTYSEDHGDVTLTMSVEQYEELMVMLGIAVGWSWGSPARPAIIRFINELNRNNPQFQPYEAMPPDK